jgi:hypothetical protein
MELTQDEILDRYLVFSRFKGSTIPFEVIYSDYLSKYAVVTEDEILFDDGMSYTAEELGSMLKKTKLSKNEVGFIHASRHFFADIKVIA